MRRSNYQSKYRLAIITFHSLSPIIHTAHHHHLERVARVRRVRENAQTVYVLLALVVCNQLRSSQFCTRTTKAPCVCVCMCGDDREVKLFVKFSSHTFNHTTSSPFTFRELSKKNTRTKELQHLLRHETRYTALPLHHLHKRGRGLSLASERRFPERFVCCS